MLRSAPVFYAAAAAATLSMLAGCAGVAAVAPQGERRRRQLLRQRLSHPS